MREPSPRTSRLAIAAGVAGAIALVGAGYLVGRRSAPMPEAPATVLAPAAPSAPAADLDFPPTLDRTALLALGAQAADAFASNLPLPATISAAAGRRFDLLLPFGCEAPGATQSQGGMRWSFDSKAGTLRISVDPTTWRGGEWSDAAVVDPETAFRGFWIARPWSTATTCAAHRLPEVVDGRPIVLSGQTVAIARPIAPQEVGKTRPYEIVQRIAITDFDPQQGFQVRILGRVQAAAGGDPIQCVQAGGGDQRPSCLITAAFAEVRIENPKNGSVLASWPIDDQVRGDETSGRSNETSDRR